MIGTASSASSAPSALRAPEPSGPGPLTARERLLRACRGQPVGQVPIWLMRQAGRYLPEYRALRSRVEFLAAVKTPDIAAEIALQPLRRFPLDAAIVFSDILMPAEAMGLRLAFEPGPSVSPPLRTRADIDRLRSPESGEGLEPIAETIRLLRREIEGRAAVIGFAGGPLTLAAYLCEGGAPGDLTALRRLLHGDPVAAHHLLEKLARVVAGSLGAQIEAGADLIVLFDTWAGLLDPRDYRTFGLPETRAIIDALRRRHPATPVVCFARGSGAHLEEMAAAGADVIGLDWTCPLGETRRRLGSRPVQGNLDPALLFAPPDILEARALAVLAEGGGTGHVFGLGHGVLPETPPEHVGRLVEIVHGYVPPSGHGPAVR